MGVSKLVVEQKTKQRTFQFKNFGSTNFFLNYKRFILINVIFIYKDYNMCIKMLAVHSYTF